MLRARLAMVWPGIRHRFGLHTFCEHYLWDLHSGYQQYRGWRCMVCDEPLGP